MSKLHPFPTAPPLQSPLLRKTPDSIPSTTELELLHDELRDLRSATLKRSRKAGDDLRAIEESMRRMKDKARAVTSPAPKLEPDDAQLPAPHRPRPPSLPASARSSLDPRRKKKRRRDPDDSDPDRGKRPPLPAA
ncbi:hypothetical protein C0993_009419, partial [Termitomyces sp. T159_Od127]